MYRFAAARAAIDQPFGAMFAATPYSICGTAPFHVFSRPNYAAGEFK